MEGWFPMESEGWFPMESEGWFPSDDDRGQVTGDRIKGTVPL